MLAVAQALARVSPVNPYLNRSTFMSEQTSHGNRELVVLLTRGTDHELSSVAFTIACGGITSGMKVYAFLVSSAVDLVRRKAVDVTHVPPLDPLKKLMEDFVARGGTIWACPPCVNTRGYTEGDFIDGVTIQGASAMHERLKAGAASLSF
jgi:predicted peroxiredoxin